MELTSTDSEYFNFSEGNKQHHNALFKNYFLAAPTLIEAKVGSTRIKPIFQPYRKALKSLRKSLFAVIVKMTVLRQGLARWEQINIPPLFSNITSN